MPDYTASVRFEAPTFTRSEFKRLARQLLSTAEHTENVVALTAEPRARSLTGAIRASAASSSRALANAEAHARGMLLRTQYIRRFAVEICVDLDDGNSNQ